MILEQLKEKMKESMKKKDKFTLSVVRMAINKLQQKSKELNRELTEAEEIDVLSKEVKQRREALKMFADRQDLIDQYQNEIKILEEYLPEQMSEEEIMQLVKEKCQELGLTGPQDMGRAMKSIMPLVKGRADGSVVRECVNKVLKG
ncbi:MAG: GatB/YqeY domain-containing protein [Desulfotomaculum sp.]|nr:GatB/YqeY domain-containing protein [Desulfotomaculum sp.]